MNSSVDRNWQYAAVDTGMRIWRVMPDVAGPWWVLELRSAATRTAAWTCLDARGELHTMAGGDWWGGLEGVRDGYAVLHGYAGRGLPTHLGIRVLRLPQWEPCWEDQAAVFRGFGVQGLLSSAPDGSQLCLRSLADGTEIPGADLRSERTAAQTREAEAWCFPGTDGILHWAGLQVQRNDSILHLSGADLPAHLQELPLWVNPEAPGGDYFMACGPVLLALAAPDRMHVLRRL